MHSASLSVVGGARRVTMWHAGVVGAVILAAVLPDARAASGDVYAAGDNSYDQLGIGDVPILRQSLVTNVQKVAAGSHFSLALKGDGTVWAWGDNGYGQLGDGTWINRSTPVQVSGLGSVTAIAATYFHSLAVKSDKTVWAWGSNEYGQLGDGTSTNARTTPTQVSSLTDVMAIAAGRDHSLAATSDGGVWAWGSNAYGQLGDGTVDNATRPVQVSDLTGVAAVAAGGFHSLAVKADKTVWAWGDNQFGQLGDGTTANRNRPVQVSGLTDVVAISAGKYFSLAVKGDGTVWTWGSNACGQLGDGTYADRNRPVQVSGLTGAIAIAAGGFHSLAVKGDGTVYGCGYNGLHQLGDRMAYGRATPVKLDNPTGVSATAAGESHSLAIKGDGTVWAWGCNAEGEQGDGTTNSFGVPLKVDGLSGSVAIATGTYDHSLAIQGDGTVKAWGCNDLGELGDGTETDHGIPTLIAGLSGVVAVSAGWGHSLSAKADGTVWAWGYQAYVQSGVGPRGTPTQVSGLIGAAATASGAFHELVVKSDGTVWAWGGNEYGQLGDGTTTDRYAPVQVGGGLAGTVAIAAGSNHSLALRGDGTVWAWGSNYWGGLGDGTQTDRNTPVQVSGLTGVVAIAGGLYHSVAIKADGTVWVWGLNGYGQLGDGTLTSRNTPVQVIGLANVVAITAGDLHSLAVKGDGTVWAWGDNSYGQLGDDTRNRRLVPLKVPSLSNISSVAAGAGVSFFLSLTTHPLDVQSSPDAGAPITALPVDNNHVINGVTNFRRTYVEGTNVSLTAPATFGGKAFVKWTKDGVDAATARNVTVGMDAAHTLIAVYAAPTLTVQSSPDAGASITVSPPDNNAQGNGATPFTRTYNANTFVTLTAPATFNGKIFTKWIKDDVDAGTSETVTVNMDAAHTVAAVYTPVPRTLSVESSPDAGAQITVSPADNNAQGDGVTAFSRTYDDGATVTLTAPATFNEKNFTKWTKDGIDAGTDATITVTMDAAHTLVAVYKPVPRTLSVDSSPDAGAQITVSPADNDGQGDGTTAFTRTYDTNTSVTLTAPAAFSGKLFVKWTKDGVDAATTRNVTVVMDAAYTLTAVYAAPTLTVQSSPAAGATITVSPPDNNGQGSGTTTFTRTYNANTPVTLTAPTVFNGKVFLKWARDGAEAGTDPAVTVNMNTTHTMVAVYTTVTWALSVQSSPAAGVQVTVSPADNNAQGNGTTAFSRTYNDGTIVTLTAPATFNGMDFTKWTKDGADAGTNATVTVTMDAAHSVAAVYTAVPRTLSVESIPAAGVRLTVSPADNDGQSDGTTAFSRTYNTNTSVTLTAPTTFSGKSFAKWTKDGVDAGTNVSVTVSMDAAHTMIAVYADPTLTVQSSPGAGAAITVSPADNNGQGSGTTDFARTYNTNTSVTLTAPATFNGKNFVRWTKDGADAGTNPAVTVDMDLAHTMVAVYTTVARTLSVQSSPSTGVPITYSSADDGTQRNGTTPFSRTYNTCTSVTLTAPDTFNGKNFAKWTKDGADAGTNATVTVDMDDTHTLTAVYTPVTRTLNVQSNPDAGAPITVAPADNDGQGGGTTPLTRTYNNNTSVTLTAPATFNGKSFVRWTKDGANAGSNANVTVNMDAAHTMIAVYAAPTLTVQSSPDAGVQIAVGPADNNGQGDGTTGFARTYDTNTSVTLTAPDTFNGKNFVRWTKDGANASTNASTSVNMDAAHTLVAVYAAPTPTETLTVQSAPDAGASVTVSPADNNGQANGATDFTRTYNMNTSVTLTAPATFSGKAFVKWTKDGADVGTNASTSVNMDAAHTMVAVYATPTPTETLTVQSTPDVGAQIAVAPADNVGHGNGTTPFSRTYNDGTIITLTAPATYNGKGFVKWTKDGADAGTNATATVTMDAAHTMAAVYATLTRALNVQSSPDAGAQITVSPTDNSAQGNGTTAFNRTYNDGTTVSLTAPATYNGKPFMKWTKDGVDAGTNVSVTVSMGAAHTLVAVYVPLVTWYRDADGDGYGAAAVSTQSVTQPSGYVANNQDCNDSNSQIHPGATDTPNDGIDQDCSGSDATSGSGTGGSAADSDADGVADADDTCPGTPAGAVADTNGCAASQRDSDADGVKDDRDQCPNTPDGTPIDANGCEVVLDADGDGVADDQDLCPGTIPGDPGDANGCGAMQRDSDGDGVVDAKDNCPDTATGTAVDANGCPPAIVIPPDTGRTTPTDNGQTVPSGDGNTQTQEDATTPPAPIIPFCGSGALDAMVGIMLGLGFMQIRRREG